MFSFRVFKAFGESKINNKNAILFYLSSSDQKIVWLNVSMNDALIMNFLNALNLIKIVDKYRKYLPAIQRSKAQSLHQNFAWRDPEPALGSADLRHG